MGRLLLSFCFAVWGFAQPLAAQAQARGNDVASIALYEGPDRMARLAEGAKKEKTLTLYTSIAASDVSQMVNAFEKKYGVKVVVWRAANEKVLQRMLAESKAGRHEVDVVQIASLELEALARENTLQTVTSPSFGNLMVGAVPSHRQWAAHYLNVWVQAYNTQKVKKQDLPRTYEDLLDPRWKGQLGIEARNSDWFYTIVESMGEKKGLKFFQDLVATNGISVRSGHSLLNNLVVSGEVPLALTVYNYMPEQAKERGAPVEWFVIKPAIARANGVAVSRAAPHPNAATLFYEFILSRETQQAMSKLGYVPTDRQVVSPMKDVELKLVDTDKALEAGEKWTVIFDNTMRGVR